MDAKYTEQETERVRQEEQSSAGITTQRLPPLVAQDTDLGHPALGRALLGLGLIGVGLLWLFSQFAGSIDYEPGIVLLSIASGLLFFAFWRRIYGLLIPGCILAGLSIGVPLADLSGGGSVLWGLALGFLGILVIGRAWFGVQNSWPLYPAVPLFLIGVIVIATQLPSILVGSVAWLPLGLIVLGIYLGWSRRRPLRV